MHHVFVARYTEGEVVMAETDDGRWLQGVISEVVLDDEKSPSADGSALAFDTHLGAEKAHCGFLSCSS